MKFYKRITKWVARCYKLMFTSSKLSILAVSNPSNPPHLQPPLLRRPETKERNPLWKIQTDNFSKSSRNMINARFFKKNIKKFSSESQRILEPSLSNKKYKVHKKITRSHSDLQLSTRSTGVLQHLGRLQWFM